MGENNQAGILHIINDLYIIIHLRMILLFMS